MFMIRWKHRGFTLIELVIFIVVVSIGMAGILSVMNTTVKSSADPAARKQALAVAESLLEEIVQKEYGALPYVCTAAAFGVTGWSRSQFDCVDDYQNYTSTSVTDAAGTAVSGLASYSIAPAVRVNNLTVNGQALKQIVVSVTGPQGVMTLTGYRGNY
jgi:MSHA pilin protein MshD